MIRRREESSTRTTTIDTVAQERNHAMRTKIARTFASLTLLLAAVAAHGQDFVNWRQYEGTTLDILGFNVSTLQGVNAVVADFEEQTGIKVVLDLYAEGAGRQVQAVELASGSGAYDVMYFIATDLPGWAESGWITPLESYLDDPDATTPGEVDFASFTQGPLSLMRWDDSLYGLPAFAATTAFYYRSDILEQHGLEPPATIEEMLEVARQIHMDPIPAVGMRGRAGPNLWTFLTFLYGMGGQIYVDYPNDMRPALDTAETARALDIYGELLREYGMPGSATANFDEVMNGLQQGQVAMVIEGAPLAVRVFDPERSRVTDTVALAQIPAGPAGRHAAYTAHGWLIPEAAQRKNAAWLFIKWITSEDVQRQMAMDAAHFAVTQSAIYDDPAFIEKYQIAPGFLENYRQNVDGSRVYHPINRAYAQVQEALGRAVSNVIVGNLTGEEAARIVHGEVDAIMRAAGFYD